MVRKWLNLGEIFALIIVILIVGDDSQVNVDDSRVLDMEGILEKKMGVNLDCCPTIVSRADWDAKPPKDRADMATPVPFVIIHHTNWGQCSDYDACAAEMRKIQEFHQVQRNWSDIGYTFCVGEDGRVYEGRGWDTVGAHAIGYNSQSIGICVMGNYMTRVPNQASIQAVFSLIQYAVENDKLVESYILYGHRQVKDTTCPGDRLFKEIQSWPHWKPGKHYPLG